MLAALPTGGSDAFALFQLTLCLGSNIVMMKYWLYRARDSMFLGVATSESQQKSDGYRAAGEFDRKRCGRPQTFFLVSRA